jgi:archaetidylinositol phosphate synthase
MALAGPNAPIAIDQQIARRAAALLARTPASPNGVTATSIAVGLTAAYLLSRGDGWIYLGGALFVVAVWMDHVDGELARQTGRTSTFGHYFDHAAAMTNYVSGFLGAGFGLRFGELGYWGPILGATSGIAIAAIMSVRLHMEVRDGRDSVRQTVRGGFEIEDTLYLLAPITWFGLLKYFIVAAGIGAPVFLLYVIWESLRAARKTPIRIPDDR